MASEKNRLSKAQKIAVRAKLRAVKDEYLITEICNSLGIGTSAWNRFLNSGVVPSGRVLPLYVLTNGLLRPSVLRPDIYLKNCIFVPTVSKVSSQLGIEPLTPKKEKAAA